MALISCPECGREISDKAVSCPHCGYPLTPAKETEPKEVNANGGSGSESAQPAEPVKKPTERIFSDIDEETPPPAEKEEKGFSPTVKAVLIIAATIFLIFVVVCSVTASRVTKENVGIDGMYNDTLGVGVKIGMKKAKVDKLLGSPDLVYDSYEYPNGLYIQYKDGKVVAMAISAVDNTWKTKEGITLGCITDDVIKALGEPRSIAHDDKWWYYGSGAVVLGLEVYMKKVVMVYIYNSNEVN